MAKAVIMPKFEMSQEEGTIVRWLKQEGDLVEKGEVLLEVETDKVVMEVEAPADGILAGIRAEEGETVPVTTTIAYLLDKGEELPKDIPQPSESKAPAEKEKESEKAKKISATPVAEHATRAARIDIADVPSSSPDGKISREDVEIFLQKQQTPVPAGKVRATPAARRAAREKQADLHQITGSGPRGRIQEQDVLSFTPAEMEAKPAVITNEEIVPLQGMRKRIAERLQLSYQTAPHIMLTVDVDVLNLIDFRTSLNNTRQKAGEGKISVTAIMVKAVARALKKHPYLNAHLLDDGIHLLPMVNLGVAVALENGLIVPVIKDADCLDIPMINEILDDLAEKARQNKLNPSEVADGTFTITNLGMYGVDHFTAIINPPQTAILAIGRITKRTVVVDEDGEESICIRPMMAMTLACDHRAVDGAAGAQFLQTLVDLVENPELLK